MGLKGKTKTEKYNNIKDAKANATFESLLEGHPIEFVKYMQYCRNLQFDQKPDYTYLKKMIEGYMQKNGYEEDFEFDWVIKKAQRLREMNPNIDSNEEEKNGVNNDNSAQKRKVGSNTLSQGLLSSI